MNLRPEFKAILVLFALLNVASCKSLKKVEARMDMFDEATGKRTFLLGKLLVIPMLAALGFKFLLFMPLFLLKMGFLGVMNFVSSNLNLLITVLMALKHVLGKHKKHSNGFEDYRQSDADYWLPESYQLPGKYEYLDQHTANAVYRHEKVHPIEIGRKPFKSSSLGHNFDRDYSYLGSDQPGKYKCTWVKSVRRKDPKIPDRTATIRKKAPSGILKPPPFYQSSLPSLTTTPSPAGDDRRQIP